MRWQVVSLVACPLLLTLPPCSCRNNSSLKSHSRYVYSPHNPCTLILLHSSAVIVRLSVLAALFTPYIPVCITTTIVQYLLQSVLTYLLLNMKIKELERTIYYSRMSKVLPSLTIFKTHNSPVFLV